MKDLSQYTIEIYGLQNKQHLYEFISGDLFFKELEQEIIESGHFKTVLTLDKSETMLLLQFHIQGTVNVVCDRSLEIFSEPVDLKERLIFKYGDNNEVLTDEIEVIKQGTIQLNLSEHIFDFIALSLPMKKLHPRFRDDEAADDILVYSSSKMEESDAIDPRWSGLGKLQNLK